MSVTHKATISINRGSGQSVPRQSVISSEGEGYIPELTCPDDETTEIGFSAQLADIKSIIIFADGTLTLRTNDGVTGDDEFLLTASNYLFWNQANLAPIPFTEDIASLFGVVAEGDGPVKITILALLDVTP